MKEIHRMDRQLLDWLTQRKHEETVFVHSIFEKVVNLQPKDSTHFISFSLGTVVQGPLMMQTDERQTFQSWKDSIQVGDAVAVKLMNDTMILVGDICWSLAKVQLWDGKLWPIPLSYGEKFEEQITEFLMENGHERDSGLFMAWLTFYHKETQIRRGRNAYSQAFLLDRKILLSSKKRSTVDAHCGVQCICRDATATGAEFRLRNSLFEALHRLDKALRNGKEQEILQASNGLVGLGAGLTPSGDDFLLGCFTIWQLFAPTLFSLYQEKDWMGQIKGRTTTISYVMLEQCLNGFVNDAFIQLCKTNQLESFLKIGSTSGIDMLIGAHFALKNIKGAYFAPSI